MRRQYSRPSGSYWLRCPHCGGSFLAYPSQVLKRNRTYCSFRWYTEQRRDDVYAKLCEPLATRLPNGCLIYNGHQSRGYGRVRIDGRNHQAHRLAWEMANDRALPDGLQACHSCPGGGTRLCVEPTHLYAGTPQQNSRDRVTSGRQVRGSAMSNARLTEDDVRAIRRRYRDPKRRISQQGLADEYGVSQGVISKVLRGAAWAHVEVETESGA